MSYTDYLATRGYRRLVVERTEKQPGDIVLGSHGAVTRVEAAANVVALAKGRARRG